MNRKREENGRWGKKTQRELNRVNQRELEGGGRRPTCASFGRESVFFGFLFFVVASVATTAAAVQTTNDNNNGKKSL